MSASFPYLDSNKGFVGDIYEIPKIDSVASLITILEIIIGNNNPSDVWYRGQSSSKYDLTPALYRKATRLCGTEIKYFNYEYPAIKSLLDQIQKLLCDLGNKQADMVDALFIAQHYHLPTPLLDWSLDPLVACWFAISRDKTWSDEEYPVIYLCSHYNTLGHKKYYLGSEQERKDVPFKELCVDEPWQRRQLQVILEAILHEGNVDDGPFVEYPLPIVSNKDLFPRLCRQSGRFTFSGPHKVWSELEASFATNERGKDERAIIRIGIAPDAVPTLRKELLILGVNEETVYGEKELDSLIAPIVKEFYEMQK